ncbi:hypothetical protein PRIPAC_98039 [Pristionchus pacificus]|uniref:Uncharacterized protein n=1 Tax=Pristionchus pacificus TaxID=54126 RepID=A0A454Y2C2_PRIPA|nr:hypothetical protein PRIPAC_98039 [Pristionchus pacificus]|eukprot:PDM77401.1 hypothetical protein PRIPAC_33131 [Pristionchus pacificus]
MIQVLRFLLSLLCHKTYSAVSNTSESYTAATSSSTRSFVPSTKGLQRRNAIRRRKPKKGVDSKAMKVMNSTTPRGAQ